MMSITDHRFVGAIEVAKLSELLESKGFIVDSAPVDARSYETFTRSLKNHVRLLAPIRNTESVRYKKGREVKNRIMATVWFSKNYHNGFVIEVFGADLQDLMVGHAASLQENLDHEVQFICRILTKKRFE